MCSQINLQFVKESSKTFQQIPKQTKPTTICAIRVKTGFMRQYPPYTAGGASRSLTQPSSSYHSHRSRNRHPKNQVVQDLRDQNRLLQEQIRLQREQLQLQQQQLQQLDEKLPASPSSAVVPSAPPSYEECMTDAPKDSKESQDMNQKP